MEPLLSGIRILDFSYLLPAVRNQILSISRRGALVSPHPMICQIAPPYGQERTVSCMHAFLTGTSARWPWI
jgi:uncharacterized NAD(P)/FAD-binding protein YdhS